MKKRTVLIISLMLLMTSILTSCLADATFVDEHSTTDGWTDAYVLYDETSQDSIRVGPAYPTGVGVTYVLVKDESIYQTFSENKTILTNVSAYIHVTENITMRGGLYDVDSDSWLASEIKEIKTPNAWFNFNLSSIRIERNKVYQLKWQLLSGNTTEFNMIYTASYRNGTRSGGTGDLLFNLFGFDTTFVVNRTTIGTIEFNNVTQTADYHYNHSSALAVIEVPVSEDVVGISEVRNLTVPPGTPATEVLTFENIIDDSYYFDAANSKVFIGRGNITNTDGIDWHINATLTGYTLHYSPPEFLIVGQYWECTGTLINDSTGRVRADDMSRTYLIYANGTTAVGPNYWNLTGGNYHCVMSTSTLIPGEYGIIVEVTIDGTTYKFGSILYISWSGGGTHSDAIVEINWYNTNYGLGLPDETLQLFINDQRQRSLSYYTYVGDQVNVTIKDFYNFTLLQYSFTVNKTVEFLDLGLTFHEYDFSNYNNEYYVVAFLKEGANRWFERICPPYGQQEFLIPTGNYTIRVYNADNSTYTAWAETVNNSRGYMIDGINITVVIDGLDVINGDILEINHVLVGALIGDVKTLCTNPPIIITTSGRDYLSDGIFKICPPQIVRATTRTETWGNWINSTAIIPKNNTFPNGTITILSDTLYFAGNDTWVDITFTDNNTLYQNTSYRPNHVDVYGQNFSINASEDILVSRVTRFHQLTMFYWIYNSNTGKYDVAIYVNNSLATPLYSVEVDVGFANNTVPDLHSVRMFDIENGNEELTEMENFFVDASGIHFDFLSLNASTSRSFNVEYYRDDDDPSAVTYSDVIVEIGGYNAYEFFPGTQTSYNQIFISWANVEDTIFKGNIIVKLDFDLETDVDPTSVRLWDINKNMEVDSSLFSYYGQSIIISNNAIGSISPSSGVKFDAYFTVEDWSKFNPGKTSLNAPLWGLPFSIMNLVTLLSFSMIVGGFLMFVLKKQKMTKNIKRNSTFLILMGVFIFVIFFILQYQV